MKAWEFPLIACWAFAGLALWFMFQARRHAVMAAAALRDAKALVARLWNEKDEGR